MKTVDVLRKAKAHISDPAMWYHDFGGYSAKGLDGAILGEPCCAMGAVAWSDPDGWLASGGLHGNNAGSFLHKASNTAYNCHAHIFNDFMATTHADIMDLFDRAITIAEAEE